MNILYSFMESPMKASPNDSRTGVYYRNIWHNFRVAFFVGPFLLFDQIAGKKI